MIKFMRVLAQMVERNSERIYIDVVHHAFWIEKFFFPFSTLYKTKQIY